MPRFTYAVTATVWLSTGNGKPWQGNITIGMRADSSAGLDALREKVRLEAEAWARSRGWTPSGGLDLKSCRPTRRV